MNDLVTRALIRKKARMATKPTKAAIERRMEGKKKKSENKTFRKKIDHRNL
jgi:ribosome-associated protein